MKRLTATSGSRSAGTGKETSLATVAEGVTASKRSFKLDSVKAGPVMGEYKVGEEMEFITNGIVDFVGTGLGRITTNGEWRESADAEWKEAMIGVPPEEGEPLVYALQGQTEPGEYPNAEFKLPHPSGDMIVPFGYKLEA